MAKKHSICSETPHSKSAKIHTHTQQQQQQQQQQLALRERRAMQL